MFKKKISRRINFSLIKILVFSRHLERVYYTRNLISFFLFLGYQNFSESAVVPDIKYKVINLKKKKLLFQRFPTQKFMLRYHNRQHFEKNFARFDVECSTRNFRRSKMFNGRKVKQREITTTVASFPSHCSLNF